MTLTRDDCAALDAADSLAPLRAQFTLPEGVIYLDGNSLGVLPAATPARVASAIQQEWGEGLIRSWNSAGWIDLPQRVGDKIARLVGAAPGELVVADSTSVNLYKVLSAALAIARADAPARRVVLSDAENFPTDLYIAQSLCAQHGLTLELTTADALEARLARGQDVAVLLWTQVNYRSGLMLDMARTTALAHAAGALALWDLAHSAGAVPVDLNGAQADFAIGCGYKYLNGGPGAPAFVWMHPRHEGQVFQPLTGWLGHAHPFDFDTEYLPAPGIQQYQCGTPPVLAMTALDTALDVYDAAQKLGGMRALRAKSLALTEAFMAAVDARVPDAVIHTPRDAAMRGSQVSLSLPSGVDGYAVMQALIAAKETAENDLDELPGGIRIAGQHLLVVEREHEIVDLLAGDVQHFRDPIDDDAEHEAPLVVGDFDDDDAGVVGGRLRRGVVLPPSRADLEEAELSGTTGREEGERTQPAGGGYASFAIANGRAFTIEQRAAREVLEFLADHGYSLPVKRLGIPDRIVEHGTQDELYKECGFDAAGIAQALREMSGKVAATTSVETVLL